VILPAVALVARIKTGVVDLNLIPAIAVVAVSALIGIVSCRDLVLVTGGAGVRIGVVKGNQLPAFGCVAGGAIFQIMALLRGDVTFLTDFKAIVIKPTLLPPGGGVTVGALPPVMFSRTVLLLVAGHTIIEAGMVKGNDCPDIGVLMAINARGGDRLG
jgi:hypothetical protein